MFREELKHEKLNGRGTRVATFTFVCKALNNVILNFSPIIDRCFPLHRTSCNDIVVNAGCIYNIIIFITGPS